jgi:hypothetical protein
VTRSEKGVGLDLDQEVADYQRGVLDKGPLVERPGD